MKARIGANVTFDENHEKIIKATGNGTTREAKKKNEMERWMRDYFTTPFGIVETTMPCAFC